MFSQYIASEIDQLPVRYQMIARHEINNVLYNVQNRAELPHKQTMQYIPQNQTQQLFSQGISQSAQQRQPQYRPLQYSSPPLVPQTQSTLHANNMIYPPTPLTTLSQNYTQSNSNHHHMTPTRDSFSENFNQDLGSPEYF